MLTRQGCSRTCRTPTMENLGRDDMPLPIKSTACTVLYLDRLLKLR